VGGWERSIDIKLDENVLEITLHEVASEPPDPEGGRTVGAGRAAHDWADDIIEKRNKVHRWREIAQARIG
jgi:hypothetical protein